jgi:hypothetical protein
MFSLLLIQGMEAREPNDKDLQSEYEPRNDPGYGQMFLKKLVGDFIVEKKFYPRSGSPVEIGGECRQAMIHNGRFLKCDFAFQQNGKSDTGLGIIGFDTDTNRFTSFWTDSRSNRVSIRQSEDAFDGKTLVLHSRQLDPNKSRRSDSVTETRIEDDGKKVVHQQYVLEQGKKKRIIMELVLIRSQVHK